MCRGCRYERAKTEAEARFDSSIVFLMYHDRPVLSLAWAPWKPSLLLVGEYRQRLVMMDVRCVAD
jgi:hypothetical protein